MIAVTRSGARDEAERWQQVDILGRVGAVEESGAQAFVCLGQGKSRVDSKGEKKSTETDFINCFGIQHSDDMQRDDL